MYIYLICDKQFKDDDSLEKFLQTNTKSNYILYCRDDFIGKKIKRHCFFNSKRCAFIKQDNKEVIDRMLSIVPIDLLVCFADDKNYDKSIKYTINSCVNNNIVVNLFNGKKKFSTVTKKGFKKMKWKSINIIDYKSEVEYSSDEEFDLSCLFKKKEENRKEVKKTKNQKKVLKQHKYIQYMNSKNPKNRKKQQNNKSMSLESFFQKSKDE